MESQKQDNLIDATASDGYVEDQAGLHELEGSDDEFLVELAQEAVAAARTTFENQDFNGTVSYIQEALDITKDLPEKWQNISDAWDVRFMAAVCSYHLESEVEAEIKLLQVVEDTSPLATSGQKQQRQMYDASHLLSQIYVKVSRTDAAQFHCDRALQGRRRLLGKTDLETYDSIALMARIYELQGNDSRAKIYRRLIHDGSKRTELENRFAQLTRSDKASEQYELVKLPSRVAGESNKMQPYSELESTNLAVVSSPSTTTLPEKNQQRQIEAESVSDHKGLPVEELDAGGVNNSPFLREHSVATGQAEDLVRNGRTLSPFDDRFSTLPEAVVRHEEVEKQLDLRSDEEEKQINLRPDSEEKQLAEESEEDEKPSIQSTPEEDQTSNASHPNCTMTLRTTEGDIHMKLRKGSSEIVSKVFPEIPGHVSGVERIPWKRFVEEVNSGKHDGSVMKPLKKEGERLVLKLEGKDEDPLKLYIDPVTMDFVFGRQGKRIFAVEGNIVVGRNLVTKVSKIKKGRDEAAFHRKRDVVRKWEIRDEIELSSTRNTLVLDPRLRYQP